MGTLPISGFLFTVLLDLVDLEENHADNDQQLSLPIPSMVLRWMQLCQSVTGSTLAL